MATKTKKKSAKKLTIQDFPFVEITIRAYNTRATEESGNKGILTFVMNTTDVTDGKPSSEKDENGESLNKIGYVGGGMGSVVVSMRNGGYYMIPHGEIWNALQKAINKGAN